MKSRDIQGNEPGSMAKGPFYNRVRRSVKNIGKNDDIEGSQPSTLVKGIKVPKGMIPRRVNPLEPEYQIPGATELSSNDPFGEIGCSMSRTNY